MFETVIAAMLKHKQIVFAAIAVAALSGMVIVPATQVAQAQLGRDIARDVLESVFGHDNDEGDDEEAAATEDQSGDDNQDIDQTQEQENDQDQEADQDVTQTNDQSERNTQANELDTGDNTATVAQSNDADQDVAAAAEASDADASAKASAENDDHHHKGKKDHSSHSDSASASADADAIVRATAEATGIIDQDNDADVRQDSSIHDVDLSNNVAFGDDTNTQIAVPIIDQDQRAANLAEQRAANLDIEDIDVFPYGITTGGGGDGGDGGDGGADLICVQPEGGGSPILIPISEREPGQQVLPLQACGETP